MDRDEVRAAKIRAARLKRKWTLEELGRRCGVGKGACWHWERGTPPSDPRLVARVLGLRIEELVR